MTAAEVEPEVELARVDVDVEEIEFDESKAVLPPPQAYRMLDKAVNKINVNILFMVASDFLTNSGPVWFIVNIIIRHLRN